MKEVSIDCNGFWLHHTKQAACTSKQNYETRPYLMFSHVVLYIVSFKIPYSYKFLRDVYFAVFVNNVWSMKIKSSKIYNSIDIILCQNPVILKNKIAKMLNLWNQRNIHPSKIYKSTVARLHKIARLHAWFRLFFLCNLW